ncbi:hypothetical protein EV184_102360 [Sinorhizobium americanum]|uniref:Uncharacterized protein n=1 Tax=Sinorhizobium americanum TaxID=194963 RepID=A0A4R2C5E3_9HYPH|nr:hypothetical protein EV184_102360 [Sinorhizobium americanum]
MLSFQHLTEGNRIRSFPVTEVVREPYRLVSQRTTVSRMLTMRPVVIGI